MTIEVLTNEGLSSGLLLGFEFVFKTVLFGDSHGGQRGKSGKGAGPGKIGVRGGKRKGGEKWCSLWGGVGWVLPLEAPPLHWPRESIFFDLPAPPPLRSPTPPNP